MLSGSREGKFRNFEVNGDFRTLDGQLPTVGECILGEIQ